MARHILAQLDTHAAKRPGHPAFIGRGPRGHVTQTFTRAQLAGAVRRVSRALASRLEPGEVLLIQLPNSAEYVAAFLGGLAAGLKVFPVHPLLTAAELTLAAQQSAAAASITPGALPLATKHMTQHEVMAWIRGDGSESGGHDQCAERPPGALVLQSSGTTGPPKLVVRSAQSLDAVAHNVADAVGLTEDDAVLAAIPLCHSYGIENGLVAPLLAGATIHACTGFDAAVVRSLLHRGGITVFPAVPVMIEALVQSSEPLDRGSLRLIYSAGSTLPAEVAERCTERLGCTPGQLYGATEVGSVTFNHPASDNFDVQRVGLPMSGVRLLIAEAGADSPHAAALPGEAGQVWISAPSMFDRLLDGGPTSVVDGYYPTGDLGTLDRHGSLLLTGRLKLLIDVGGLKVNPYEVEAVIASHPQVDQCVVVPAHVSPTVTRLHAWVVPVSGQTIDTAALRAFARARLAPYKVPRVFEVADQIPRTSLGKVQRMALIEKAV